MHIKTKHILPPHHNPLFIVDIETFCFFDITSTLSITHPEAFTCYSLPCPFTVSLLNTRALIKEYAAYTILELREFVYFFVKAARRKPLPFSIIEVSIMNGSDTALS